MVSNAESRKLAMCNVMKRIDGVLASSPEMASFSINNWCPWQSFVLPSDGLFH